MINKEILKIENLSCILKVNGLKIVDNVSFTINHGETIALLGESGVGKTTLFRAILQLLPRSVWETTGNIYLGGMRINDLPPKELEKVRGRVARCIFQEPGQSLNPSLKIETQLKEAITTVSPEMSGEELDKVIKAALTNGGLKNPSLIDNKYPGDLSGGQRQRVGISMTLSCPCDILLADEPSNSLDAVTVTELVQSLKNLKESKHIGSILCVTHDLSVVSALNCERVLFMHAGKMYEAGSIQNVLKDPSAHEQLEELVSLAKKIDRHGKIAEIKQERRKRDNMLSIKDLNFGFLVKSFLKKERPLVVKDVSFDVGKREFIGLVGSSGSGKSTIGSILSRLLTGYMGEITYNGKNIIDFNAKDRIKFHRSLQVVFQDPADTFDPAITMNQNLEECFKAIGMTKSEIGESVAKLLKLLSLDKRLLNELPGNLSGGQKQRFALLRAFGSTPSVIIADEPFTHLDLISQNRMIEYMQMRKKSAVEPMGCILISHEIGIVAKLCDRIIVVDDGYIVEDNSAYNVVNSPVHKATQKLIGAAKMLGTMAS